MNERGRYELLDRIGQGGMAELYRARAVGEQGIARLLAIKRIRPELATDEAFVKMMFEEARLASDLSHPNLVQVYELGRDAVGYFIAMELVNGPSLSTLLRRLASSGRSLPEACALDVVIQLLRALDYAHQKTDLEGHPLHIVHRDVSPDNVLLTASGAAKLTDFGIAKARNSPKQTLAGALKGKPRYMSPEQARGTPLDSRSDIFSAGLVLWECLTGRPRFAAPNELALLAQVAENRWTSPAELGLQLAPALEAALGRAMASLPEERFQSAGDFARELAGHHRRAWPDYVPEALGALVKELYGADLEVLDARLRRLLAGVEPPAGSVGVPEVEAFAPRPIDASSVPTVPDTAKAVADVQQETTEPVLMAVASATDQPAQAASVPADTLLEPERAAVPPVQKAEVSVPPPAPGTDGDAAQAPAAQTTSAGAAVPAASSGPTKKQRRRAAEDAQIAQAIAEANAAELAEKKAASKTPLAMLLGVFLGVGALSGGLMALLDGSTSSTPVDEIPSAASSPPVGGTVATPATAPETEPEPAKTTTTRRTETITPAAPTAKGYLSLTCQPECEVLLKGKIIGYSPLSAHELPAGRHRILVRNRLANLSKTITVEIEPGATTSREVNLVLGP